MNLWVHWRNKRDRAPMCAAFPHFEFVREISQSCCAVSLLCNCDSNWRIPIVCVSIIFSLARLVCVFSPVAVRVWIRVLSRNARESPPASSVNFVQNVHELGSRQVFYRWGDTHWCTYWFSLLPEAHLITKEPSYLWKPCAEHKRQNHGSWSSCEWKNHKLVSGA